MHCRNIAPAIILHDQFTPMLSHAKISAEQRLCRSRAKADDDSGLEHLDLGLKPWMTRDNFLAIRFAVNAELPFWLPLEVFDRVRDVCSRAIKSRVGECAIQQRTGRSDKRLSRAILFVSGLLAYKNVVCIRRPLAEDRLCSALPQVASLTLARGLLKRRKIQLVWEKLCSGNRRC